MIETDMQFSKDGKVVLNHDASFQGYNIANTNYVGGLDQLHLSNGETLPLLDDLLDVLEASPNDTTRLLLDIKNANCIETAVNMVFSRGLEDRCCWNSSSDADNSVVRQLYANHSKVPYVNLTFYSAPDFSKISPTTSQSLGFYKAISVSVMKEAVTKGYEVFYWTIDSESELKTYMKYYVPTICTNYSRRLINLKESLKSE